MTLRFGTFNLFQFVAPPFSWYIKKDTFTKEEFSQKTQWIKAQIKTMNCDVIGFQEVFSIDELESLVKELGFKYFLTVDTPKLEKKTVFVSTVVALASKYPIKKVHTMKQNEHSIKKYAYHSKNVFARQPIKATIELPNKQECLVYVCHLKSNRLNEFEYIFKASHTLEFKKEQTQKALENSYSYALRQRLCEAYSLFWDIKKLKLPCILMGDLNDKQYSITHEVLSNEMYHDPQCQKHLLTDAYELFSPIQYNPHPQAKAIKRTPTSYYQGQGHIIDYIFISQFHKGFFENFKISNYEVYDAHLQQQKDGSLLQSDHAQVVCELKMEA